MNRCRAWELTMLFNVLVGFLLYFRRSLTTEGRWFAREVLAVKPATCLKQPGRSLAFGRSTLGPVYNHRGSDQVSTDLRQKERSSAADTSLSCLIGPGIGCAQRRVREFCSRHSGARGVIKNPTALAVGVSMNYRYLRYNQG